MFNVEMKLLSKSTKSDRKRNEYFENRVREITLATRIWKKKSSRSQCI